MKYPSIKADARVRNGTVAFFTKPKTTGSIRVALCYLTFVVLIGVAIVSIGEAKGQKNGTIYMSFERYTTMKEDIAFFRGFYEDYLIVIDDQENKIMFPPTPKRKPAL